MDTPLSPQLNIIIPAYRMHTQTFLNALDGISEADAKKRIEGRTNHIVWMAGNFVNVRYGIASVLGIQKQDPYNSLFFMGKTLDDSFVYPNLSQLKESFHDISSSAYAALLKVNDKKLAEKFHMGMEIPFIEENVLNFIGMCIGREDYLTGQMSLMRRILNYPGMKYDVDQNLKY